MSRLAKIAGVVVLVVVSLAHVSVARAQEPEGDNGIASSFPGDVGIENHPDVVFVENFEEGSVGNVAARWDEAAHSAQMSLSGDVPALSSGTQSILMHKQPGDGTPGAHLYTRLLPGNGENGYHKLYARVYLKFGAQSDVLHHFGTNLGGNNPATPWPDVSAGNRPAGDRSFWTGVEPYGDAWTWDFYTYWMEMRSYQNPDGTGTTFWGNAFLRGTSAENWAPVGPPVVRGEWICVEMMMKINDPPTGHGGEQAFWINGQLWRRGGQIISHLGEGFPTGTWLRDKFSPEPGQAPFEGYRWRNAQDLLINYVWLYIYTEQDGYDIPVWYDDLVVATSYIGPLYSGTPRPDGGPMDPDGGTQGTDGGSGADDLGGGCGCRVKGMGATGGAGAAWAAWLIAVCAWAIRRRSRRS